MKRNVILIGLSGSGKTTVGAAVAGMIGGGFCDCDEAIEKKLGQSIVEIFAEQGEAAFRRVEEELMNEAILDGVPGVIVPGGGWCVQGENMSVALRSGLTVYLQVAPAEAIERLKESAPRPLLGTPDSAVVLSAQLDSRREVYERSEVAVDTNGKEPQRVALTVANLARKLAGW